MESKDTKETAAIDRRFIVRIGDKDFVKFEGLLCLGHQQGLRSVHTELVQVPNAENEHTAIFRAEVELDAGKFTAYGDASPSSVSSLVGLHYLRCGETRSVARALRFATNVGMCSVEELGDLNGWEDAGEGLSGNGETDVVPEGIDPETWDQLTQGQQAIRRRKQQLAMA